MGSANCCAASLALEVVVACPPQGLVNSFEEPQREPFLVASDFFSWMTMQCDIIPAAGGTTAELKAATHLLLHHHNVFLHIEHDILLGFQGKCCNNALFRQAHGKVDDSSNKQ